MIPATYIAKKIAQKKQQPAVTNPGQPRAKSKIEKTALKIGLGALGAFAVYLVGKKIVKNIRKTRSERRFSQEAQQALLLRSSLNPSGISWLHWMDGTKEEAIYNIAIQITNFRKVQQEYRNLFNRSLVNDLEKELKIEEYKKFMDIINSGGLNNQILDNNTIPSNDNQPVNTNDGYKGKVILITKPTKIYEKFTWYPWGSVLKADKDYFINHLANGNVKKIHIGYGRFANFIETMIKTNEGSVKTIYVNEADVTLVSKEVYNQRYKGLYKKIVFRNSDF